jgi:signal transduction histidine kinase
MLVLHLLDNDEIVVKGDKARISEAMWNLLNKVIKFIEEEHFLRQEKKMIIPF